MSSSESQTFGAQAAQENFPKLLEKVEAGEAVTITRHGVPVAKLVPVKHQESTESRRAAIDKIKALGRELSLGDLRIRDLIQEGRR